MKKRILILDDKETIQAHSRHYAEQRRQHHRTNKTTRNRCGRLYRKAL